MTSQIIFVYAALLALLFVALSVRTIRLRQKYRVVLGDNQQAELQRAIRAHANFAEYVPLGLLLLYAVQAMAAPALVLHALGLLLLLGRISHAYSISQVQEPFRFRIAGMMMTFTSLLLAAVYILFKSWVA